MITCSCKYKNYDNYLHSFHNNIDYLDSGGLIKQWRLDKKECVFTIKEKRQTMGVVYHPKKPKLFAFGDDGKILMYDTETRKNELIYQCR